MQWLDGLLKELSELSEVAAVAAADDTGSYLAGMNVDDADEFAAILTFIGRSGMTIEDLLGLDELSFISLSGKNSKLIVHKIHEYFVGIRLSKTAVISKLEAKINKLVENVDVTSG